MQDKREKLLRKLYEILSTLQYNSERRELLEHVLARFITGKDLHTNVASEVRRLFDEKVLSTKGTPSGLDFLKSENFKQMWFEQEGLLLSNIPHQYIPEYIVEKCSAFSQEFQDIYDFDLNSLWLFAFKLSEYIEYKKASTGFSDEIYSFGSKKEYADLGFVKTPPDVYVEQWKNVITINKEELARILFRTLSSSDIRKILEINSIDFDNPPQDSSEIRFSSTPIIRIGEDLVVMAPWYLTRSLPSTYEKLLKKCMKYTNSKGKTFEKMVQSIFRRTSFNMLSFNVRYGENSRYEADAIIGFEKSLWIIESSSHPVSSNSWAGDPVSIRNDLKKSLEKCKVQGERAIKHIESIPIPYSLQRFPIKGIIIVADGVYPNLNLDVFMSSSAENIPVYMVNWFDLRTLLDQPEIDFFEEFLMWRTKKPMPVMSFDEKDYWAFYFDRYRLLRGIREAFKTMLKKRTTLIYSSYRFNRKDYLAKIVGKEAGF